MKFAVHQRVLAQDPVNTDKWEPGYIHLQFSPPNSVLHGYSVIFDKAWAEGSAETHNVFHYEHELTAEVFE